jgi:dynactin 1
MLVCTTVYWPGLNPLAAQFDSALIKLSNAEVQIEDLKLQLDDAMGAEEMLVQLTERNLMLGEVRMFPLYDGPDADAPQKIEEMRITIEDLEALKELNDELEENHVDTERALQAELDARDLAVHAQARRAAALEDACADADETIAQFRALVLALQQDLDGLRAQSASATEESARAASQSAAMRSLNLKLQSSATKSQARAIDFELKNIEAKEAQQLLSIVQVRVRSRRRG